MAWFDSDWSSRIKITANASQVDENLTDYRYYYDLSEMPAHFHSLVKSDGGDLVITQSDGSTRLPLDIDFITPASSIGSIFFKDNTDSASDKDFYVYYGNSAASQPAVGDTYGRNAVYDSNYDAVWHLQEDPSGGAPQMTDSTGTGNDATSVGSMTSGDSVAGKLAGNALDFDGTDDYLNIGLLGSFGANMADNTLEFWHKTSTDIEYFFFGGRTNTSNKPRIDLLINFANSGTRTKGGMTTRLYDSSGTALELIAEVNADTGLTDGDWHRVFITMESSTDTVVVYVDDTAQSVSYIQQQTPVSFTNFATYHLGLSAWVDRGTPSNTKTNITDEFMLSRTNRSAGYATTSYNMQNDPGTFWTTGSPEPGSSTVMIY